MNKEKKVLRYAFWTMVACSIFFIAAINVQQRNYWKHLDQLELHLEQTELEVQEAESQIAELEWDLFKTRTELSQTSSLYEGAKNHIRMLNNERFVERMGEQE